MHPFEDVAIVAQYVRSLFPAHPVAVERVVEGGSTCVYCIGLPDKTYYLRIWPESGESFAPERLVHERLRAARLHVPEVIHYEAYNETLQRSVMLTTAIPGRAIGYGQPPAAVQHILHHAGRELAQINQVSVQGYGWLDRADEDPGVLRAEYATLPLWLTEHFAAPIRALQHCHDLSPRDVALLLALLEEAKNMFRHDAAVLAHGDFDVTHIFYDHTGYTGIIDFGEIRGAHQLYDLGHFAVDSYALLPFLIEGYSEIIPLATDAMQRIHLIGVLIAARRVGLRMLQERKVHQPDIVFVRRMLPALTFLVDT